MVYEYEDHELGDSFERYRSAPRKVIATLFKDQLETKRRKRKQIRTEEKATASPKLKTEPREKKPKKNKGNTKKTQASSN